MTHPPGPPPLVDPALVRRAREGDPAAFGRLVAATEGLVRAAVRATLGDAALADDAVQETYLRSHRRLATLREDAAFVPWLRRVAVSCARNLARRERPLPVDPAVLDAAPARPPDDDARLHAALRRALVALPTAERRLLQSFHDGTTAAALAADAGVAAPAMRKRLERLRAKVREEMRMTLANDDTPDGGLSHRIVALLARPLLLERPGNPVGEVWDRIRTLRAGDEVVDLPEEFGDDDLSRVAGGAVAPPPGAHRPRPGRLLRWDLSVPMLVHARGRPCGAHLLAGGKVYRDDAEDRTHLRVFHQAELLWTGRGLAEWSAMDVLGALLDDLLPGLRVRVDEMDFPLTTDRAHEVAVEHDGTWVAVAGWARYAPRVASALGLDPRTEAVLGIGLGLERIACIRHGIADVREVESARIPAPGG